MVDREKDEILRTVFTAYLIRTLKSNRVNRYRSRMLLEWREVHSAYPFEQPAIDEESALFQSDFFRYQLYADNACFSTGVLPQKI